MAATRYAPAGVRSFGPLRASLGLDPAAHEARASVFAMIETARGLAALDEICAVPGLSGVYVGPADLAISLGHKPAEAWTDTGSPRRDGAHPGRRVAAAGLVAGIHAGAGKPGKAMAEMGFRMITLASESQALRRGAAEHLEGGAVTLGSGGAGHRCRARTGRGDRQATARRRVPRRRLRRARSTS